MKATSQEANKILNKLQEDIRTLKAEENNNFKFVAATIENEEYLRPEYDFKKTQNKIALLEEKVRKLKHAINVFNCTYEVDGYTIDQILIFLPQLNQTKMKLFGMLSQPPKRRKSVNGNIIDYEYLNYNIEDAKKEYEAVDGLLTRLQNKLNLVNSTVEFDIPD